MIALNIVPDEEIDGGRMSSVEAPLEELLRDVARLQDATGYGRCRRADRLRHLLPNHRIKPCEGTLFSLSNY